MRDSVRGPEMFMVRRHDRSPFMARAHVFPGGRVDAGDRAAVDSEWCDGIGAAAHALEGLAPDEALAHFVAGARELFEEAGVLLARDAHGFVSLAGEEDHRRFGEYRREVHSGVVPLRTVLTRQRLRLALDALTPCAHWVTPPVDTRRFDTRFFVARLPPGQTPAHDETETTHGEWMTAAGAIRAAEAREIILPPPTWVTLSELTDYPNVDALVAGVAECPITRREPGQDSAAGRRVLIMQSQTSRDMRRFVWTEDRWLPEELAS